MKSRVQNYQTKHTVFKRWALEWKTYIQIQFLDFPAVWPQVNYLNFLWFGFFIYKVELVDNGIYVK